MSHVTVLLEESVRELAIEPGDVVVDATVGGAGHFQKLFDVLGPTGTLLGIDADSDALVRAKEAVAGKSGPMVRLKEGNFRDLAQMLDEEGLTPTKVLFDLGWSGFHLLRGRGFSFRTDEPLLMMYGDPSESTTARDLVNHLSEESLADLLWSLGEERFSRSIARAIVAARDDTLLETTFDLVRAIEAGTPAWYKHRRVHPATKTFQALRIAVNDELGALREGLAAALTRVEEGGRIAVITFHSIEDRIVKQVLREAVESGTGTLVGRKPIVPSASELEANPRARSAKLRVFEIHRAQNRSINLTSFPAYA